MKEEKKKMGEDGRRRWEKMEEEGLNVEDRTECGR
jgi:hypothetical protein